MDGRDGDMRRGGSNAVHLIEDLLFLALDDDALGLADGGEAVAEVAEGDVAVVDIDDHHHVEEVLEGGLVDVEDVDVVVCEIGADGGDNTDGIFANYGYYCAVHRGVLGG
jgi:hypothetical protein